MGAIYRSISAVENDLILGGGGLRGAKRNSYAFMTSLCALRATASCVARRYDRPSSFTVDNRTLLLQLSPQAKPGPSTKRSAVPAWPEEGLYFPIIRKVFFICKIIFASFAAFFILEKL